MFALKTDLDGIGRPRTLSFTEGKRRMKMRVNVPPDRILARFEYGTSKQRKVVIISQDGADQVLAVRPVHTTSTSEPRVDVLEIGPHR